MIHKEYLELANRTEKSPQLIYHDLNYGKIRLIHAFLGLASEVSEFDDAAMCNNDLTNLIEELGDIEWYLAILFNHFGFEIVVDEWPMEKAPDLSVAFGDLYDLIKRDVIYGKAIEAATYEAALRKAVSALGEIRKLLVNSGLEDLTHELIWKTNINKLTKRYPNLYSDHDAINRDTAAERTVLEESIG